MTERRNSDRHALKLMVRETNGDYLFSLRTVNLSEDGIFLENKFCVSDQEPFSKLTFTLPNGKQIRNVVAKIVRENQSGESKGSAYEFVNISEEARMELKRYFCSFALAGNA